MSDMSHQEPIEAREEGTQLEGLLRQAFSGRALDESGYSRSLAPTTQAGHF